MTTLLTGATGFVGSAVARTLLARGHTLRLLVRPNSDRTNLAGLQAELAEGDLTDPASLTAATAGCRYLFHVAADYRLWVPDPAAMMAANVEGTRTLLLAAQKAGVERIVYCSSVAALGLTDDGTPATETTPVHEDRIIGTYKRSKYRAEQAVLALARDHAMPVVIVNPSTPVGPRDIKPTPTGKMIRDAAAGRMPAYVESGSTSSTSMMSPKATPLPWSAAASASATFLAARTSPWARCSPWPPAPASAPRPASSCPLPR